MNYIFNRMGPEERGSLLSRGSFSQCPPDIRSNTRFIALCGITDDEQKSDMNIFVLMLIHHDTDEGERAGQSLR